MPVLILFFLSGATALVYEVVWSRHLSLMLGSTVQAQTVVLAVFMGGLALGNRAFGRRADASPHPLALYGRLEIAIGLYAFFFNQFFRIADGVFISAGSRVAEHSAMLLLLKAGLSVALLLGPTVLMGGTLPILAAWLQRRGDDPGRRTARFYSTNSLGAVAGAWLAAFVLVPELGMTSSLQVTAMLNVLVGFAAIGLSRREAATPAPEPGNRRREEPESAAARVTDAAAPGLPLSDNTRLAAGIVALTGAVSMALEVLASRSLALIFGSSLQSFAIVLMAFILGIGAGGAVVASPRTRGWRRDTMTVALLLAASAWTGALVLGIERWVGVYCLVRSGLASSEMGWLLHQQFTGAAAVFVLGVPAGLLGAVLPLWLRELPAGGAGLGRGVGRLLTWNTLGAVAGSLLAGFVLMPLFGLRGAFLAAAISVAAAAALLAKRSNLPPAQFVAAAVAGAVLAGGLLWGEGWRHTLSAGAFRARDADAAREIIESRKRHMKLLFYEDAADATVTVEKGDGIGKPAFLSLRVNGKTDASTEVDLATQYLLAHLPMLARPQSRDVFVLGLGSGITAGALLGHPVERIVIAENCAPVVRAGALFAPWNRGVLTNRLARVAPDDGRTALKLSPPQSFDAIISEPSNPWMAGVGSVFSREFYELCASRLKDGGIMTQWFHTYEMTDGLAGLILNTFGSVFPHMEIWDPGTGDLILLGSHKPWNSSPGTWSEVFNRPVARADLEAIGVKSPEALWARQFASQRTAHAVADVEAMQTDEFPILEYEAPKAFYMGSAVRMLLRLDERTGQQALAPAAKREALAVLGVAGAQEVFARFGSVNPSLTDALAGRVSTDGALAVPLAFLPTRPATDAPSAVELRQAGPRLRKLLEAEQSLGAEPARLSEAVAAIESAVNSSESGPRDDSQTERIVTAAARACLARGETALAGRLLGLRPAEGADAVELRFLRRIHRRDAGNVAQRP